MHLHFTPYNIYSCIYVRVCIYVCILMYVIIVDELTKQIPNN